jgi:dienelactone hydrolase
MSGKPDILSAIPSNRTSRFMRSALLLASACLLSAPSASMSAQHGGPSMHVTPGTTVLAGDSIGVTLDGLPAGASVDLTAERLIVSSFHGGRRILFRSRARFTATADGRVELATAAPTAGSYSGADPRGLFWSMVPTPDSIDDTMRPNRVRLVARAAGAVIADTTIVFQNSLPQLRIDSVPGFPGALLASLPGGGRRPVIIVLGGSEGGSGAARSEGARLASRGFAVLGLPYYSPAQAPGGPREIEALPASFTDIPVDRLEQAYRWLRTRDDVDPERIALFGGSKGAELALLAAAHFPWVKAVVAVAPSDVVWEGWGWEVEPGTRSSFSLNGQALPFVPYDGMMDELMKLQTGEPIHIRRFHDRGRALYADRIAAARIPVERFRGRLMLIAGDDDQLWSSGEMARSIVAARRAAGLETVALIFPDAGHLLNGSGWSPTTHYDMGQQKHGGRPDANARAQAQAWPAMLEFLHAALR